MQIYYSIMQMWLIHESGLFVYFMKKHQMRIQLENSELYCYSQAETDRCGSFQDLPADNADERVELFSLEITLLWADCPLTGRKQAGMSGISSVTQMAITVTVVRCTMHSRVLVLFKYNLLICKN